MLHYAKYPKHKGWELIYANYTRLHKKAVDLISRELGKFIIRDEGIYTLYVLPCRQENGALQSAKNLVIVGVWENSPLIQSLVDASECKDGYLIKTMKNPADEDCSFIILTAKDERSLYYGAVDLCYDFPVQCAPIHGSLRMENELFKERLRPYQSSGFPKMKTRSIFTWGHPLNDYKAYFDDMARLRLTQVILWNDYLPINAKEVVEYAHGCGIEVIFGYAWGWQAGCNEIESIDEEYLRRLKEKVVAQYEKDYAHIGCDGIYFQSFTELSSDTIGGRIVADVVADFVNDTAGTLLSKYPDLRIQFGLHATSVKNHLQSIAKVDKRVEIIWEDCGEFPFAYVPVVEDEQAFERTKTFVRDILYLRGLDAPTGFVFRGFATLDWENFAYQGGPFVLGDNAVYISQHDQYLRESAWRSYSSDWLKYGQYAQKMAAYIYELSEGNAHLCMAGLFDGGVWLPEALCSEIFWNPTQDYAETMRKVYARSFVKKV